MTGKTRIIEERKQPAQLFQAAQPLLERPPELRRPGDRHLTQVIVAMGTRSNSGQP